MNQELTLQRLLSVYWLVAWRGYVGGAVLGAIAGFIWVMLGGTVEASSMVGGIAGLVWSFFVLQMAFRKKYHDFRIVLERV
jgi:hypothetical protein